MKLLQILYSGLGGHANVAFSLIEGDVESTFSHELLFFGIEDLPQEYENKSKEIKAPFHVIKKKKGKDVWSVIKVMYFVFIIKPEVIILHSVPLLKIIWVFHKILRIKLILVEHNDNSIKTITEWNRTLFSHLKKVKIVYLNDLYSDTVKHKINKNFNSDLVHIVSNGINNETFNSNEHAIKENLIKIVMISRFTNQRKHEKLIELLAGYSDKIELTLCGTGETLEVVKNYCQNLKYSFVKFSGMIGEKMIVDKLHQNDIYVHWSAAETQSTSILQAMSCGLPVVASNIPGNASIIQNEKTGFLVDLNDTAYFKTVLTKLMDNKELREEIGRKARSYILENHSHVKMFKKYKAIIEI